MKAKRRIYTYLGFSLWIASVVFILLPIWPHVYYRLSPQTSTVLAATISQTIEPSPITLPPPPPESLKPPLPPFDPKLPEENGLIIDKIGVRGQIHEGENWEQILRQGVWRIPNFGTPEDNGLPIILAAHRWGYLSWSNSFRTLNSFYNLPKLEIGDKINIIWKQREYIYEVYASETGEKITNYAADLILYTCQLWNSPIRVFKYAKRVI